MPEAVSSHDTPRMVEGELENSNETICLDISQEYPKRGSLTLFHRNSERQANLTRLISRTTLHLHLYQHTTFSLPLRFKVLTAQLSGSHHSSVCDIVVS